MAFIFEKLIVYQKALGFFTDVQKILKTKRSLINRELRDQLYRAALSITLNIAEGNGRWHAGDKRNFLWIARGSVFECVALIQILKSAELISDAEYRQMYSVLEELSKILVALIQRLESPSVSGQIDPIAFRILCNLHQK